MKKIVLDISDAAFLAIARGATKQGSTFSAVVKKTIYDLAAEMEQDNEQNTGQSNKQRGPT